MIRHYKLVCEPGDYVSLLNESHFSFPIFNDYGNFSDMNDTPQTIEEVSMPKGTLGKIVSTYNYSHSLVIFHNSKKYELNLFNSSVLTYFNVVKRKILLENNCHGHYLHNISPPIVI